MIRTGLVLLVVAGCSLAGEAQALSLTNRDPNQQWVEIIEGPGQKSRTVAIDYGETLDAPCDLGCTVILDNGAEERFEGDEIVHIENGRFTVIE